MGIDLGRDLGWALRFMETIVAYLH